MKKIKSIQKFSKKRIQSDREISPAQALEFIEEYQQLLQGNEGARKLISMRVPEKLLNQFKQRCKKKRIPYQSQIVELMRIWMKSDED